MIEIRPSWHSGASAIASSANINRLVEAEQRLIQSTNVSLAILGCFTEQERVDQLSALTGSAEKDLIAGTEIARCGYLKQAYSLWRSWFEQTIFAIYFFEAPLHRLAWRVSDAVSLEEGGPPYRLMLHQLIKGSGEKHPFAIVYEERFAQVREALRMSKTSKKSDLMNKADRVLTALSQGVHGTFQPKLPAGVEDVERDMERHALEVLGGAAQVVEIFWALLVSSVVAFPESFLLKLREGQITEQDIVDVFEDAEPSILAFQPVFSRAFSAR